ncbi:MAG: hypothetical protein UU36_C0032G0008 [Candidatus Uhrbacteria bacterium GW2011_GWE2_41_1153]|nr:MAG: hypothetical protein UU36_C0032G0008 [Candidatus Uhrbacteria bacterium GW2011_GWE2_41_1153]
MEFKDLSKKVVENAVSYGEKYNVQQALLIHRKKSRPEKHVTEEVSRNELAKELADVVGMAIVIANLFGIDLEDAIDKKWIAKSR